MISSEDVRHVTFDKAFQGYRREDVDDYLKQVAQAMDDLAAQNDDLQKKLVMLAQRIEKYRTMENSLSTSMINAQRMGDSIIRESKQKAAEIIRSANIKAEDREQRARDDVELAKQEIVTLKGEADSFKRSLIEMYRKHINLINKLPDYTRRPEDEPVPPPSPAPEQAAAPAAEPQPAVQAPVYTAPAADGKCPGSGRKGRHGGICHRAAPGGAGGSRARPDPRGGARHRRDAVPGCLRPV